MNYPLLIIYIISSIPKEYKTLKYYFGANIYIVNIWWILILVCNCYRCRNSRFMNLFNNNVPMIIYNKIPIIFWLLQIQQPMFRKSIWNYKIHTLRLKHPMNFRYHFLCIIGRWLSTLKKKIILKFLQELNPM